MPSEWSLSCGEGISVFQVRVENVKDPINHVEGVLGRVKEEYLLKTYSIEPWNDTHDFLTKICLKTGRLLKVKHFVV